MNMEKSEKTTETSNKKIWTDAERLELAAKLDKELEDYIDNLDKKSYSNGWSEDCWQEEMEKHPFFMTEMPENPTEVSPLIEGLQQLKYGEEYNTPNELAQSYKDDGNFNYKHKKYRLAILCFSKGIASKCEDTNLMAQLYSNRALAQLKLKNYRSSLNDCKQVLKLNSNYLKAFHTAAKCCFHIKNYDECINYCDQILNLSSKEDEVDKDIVSMRSQAVKNKKLLLRDSRLQNIKEKNEEKIKDTVVELIKARNINLDNSDLFYDSHHVHIVDNSLVWPVVFAYPENNQTDFIQEFNELTILKEQLIEMFEEAPAWDSDKRYQIKNLNLYFEGVDQKLYKVNINHQLMKILQHEKYVVKNGTPWFFILVANSEAEKSFLKDYS